ncbi:MAG TPA: outer membrane beta-barrel protein [Gemmatimonadales bacterium]|nr:outer membrane beta-barrel protein [Gemmatimonadales bacterium]
MMKVLRIPSITAALALWTSALQAQTFSLYGFGGGYSALNDLTPATLSTVNFKTGWNVGAGLGLSLLSVLEIRGEVALVNSRRQGAGTNTDWRKIFSGGDLKLRLPLPLVSPYVFAGGGVVMLDEEGTTTPISSRRAGRGGVGVDVSLGRLGVLAQAASWFYQWDATKFPSFTEQQFDVLYSVGLRYRLGS